MLVAEQVPSGLEVFIGMSRDPAVGPVVVVGAGGGSAEHLPGKISCLAPISLDEARRMVADARVISKTMSGESVDAVARAIVAVGDLATANPRIVAVDVNPVIVSGQNAVAVDALVVVEVER